MSCYQDWDDVIIRGRGSARPRTSAQRSNAAQQAFQNGEDFEVSKKYGGGGNRQRAGPQNSKKIEESDMGEDAPKIKSLDRNVSLRIQQARQAKGWTQKELAQKINEKPQVINEYESGRAIPNQQILGKLERVLGTKLRGKI